jgi:hypothetical protein
MKRAAKPEPSESDEEVVTLDVERWTHHRGPRPPMLEGRAEIATGKWNRLELWRDAMPDHAAVTDRFIGRLVTIGAYYLQRVETAPSVLVDGEGRLVWAKSGAEVDDLLDALDSVDAWLVRRSTLASDVRREAWRFAVGDTPLPAPSIAVRPTRQRPSARSAALSFRAGRQRVTFPRRVSRRMAAHVVEDHETERDGSPARAVVSNNRTDETVALKHRHRCFNRHEHLGAAHLVG